MSLLIRDVSTGRRLTVLERISVLRLPFASTLLTLSVAMNVHQLVRRSTGSEYALEEEGELGLGFRFLDGSVGVRPGALPQ